MQLPLPTQKLAFRPIFARTLAPGAPRLGRGAARGAGVASAARGAGVASGVGGGGFGFRFGGEGAAVGGGGVRVRLGRGVAEGAGVGWGWGVGRGRGVLERGAAQGVAALVRVQGSRACAGRALGVVRVFLHGRDLHHHVVAVEGVRFLSCFVFFFFLIIVRFDLM